MPTFPLILAHAQLDAHNAELMAEIARDTDTVEPNPAGARVLSRLGDEQQLRGIPCVGEGVTGAIPGTKPGGSH